MENATVNLYELTGSSYEIGYQLGKKTMANPQLTQIQKSDTEIFTDGQLAQMNEMFDRYCPGLSDELRGFAKAVGASEKQMYYYAGTCLTPGCSLIAALPSLTKDGRVLVARNYEFSHKMEDFSFGKTKVNGKYAHIGSSSMLFGRSEGINECGLMVGSTSCGLPVGNFEPMRKPAINGLQFWAVIRSLLENCKDVDEALKTALDIPIAYNINLMLADKTGKAVLLETFDGEKEWKLIDSTTAEQYLHSTNHAHLPKMKQLCPIVMEHSTCRYDYISKYMVQAEKLTPDDLKSLLLSEYPSGLCCHWYDEFFGTIRSMVFDVTAGTVEVCFGGLAENGWTSYSLSEDFKTHSQTVHIQSEHPTFDFCKLL
ncbi:C45 family autoproteolytic acyltransferase/hydolase [Eubacterium barkeri]|uniref:Predicted choloylglycine hydrolase n=1 Tax=Eubacterium barkeri TaxID=1528 RepID=A0A1H3BS51_EUBBA|nr:C45 family peptidase [Eubacterium barkeri]SDX44753.1 Predicted choloylglycine hydrolase [Eubacterium barkeri]